MPSVYSREHYLENREAINARTMKNYHNNRAERLERFKEYYQKNKEVLKQKKAERSEAKNPKPKPVFKITHNVVASITDW
jgi:tRNA A37 N6-isopentenylltransferase MiaA